MQASQKIWISGVILGSVFLGLLQSKAEAEVWANLEKSNHFLIYYQEAPAEYLSHLVNKAERCYQDIADYLGFRRFDFWTWDNRCKIFLYPDAQQYLKTTGSVSWSRGSVEVYKKEISTYINQDVFFDIILPHEIGHIIFREFVGYKNKLPLWLDEGVACMQEYGSSERLLIAQHLVKLRLYTRLEEFSKIHDSSVIIPFIFYNEAASIVDFLLRKFGRSQFVQFCRWLRDEQDWEQALKSVYRFNNIEELEQAWVADAMAN